MEEVGKIIKTEGGEAIVRIRRHSACSNCRHKCQLAGSASDESAQIEVRVDNTIGARSGQRVVLRMKEQSLVFASLIIYLLPLFALIGGYFVGVKLGSLVVGQAVELAGIIGSLIFFGLSLGLVRFLDYLLSSNKDYHPRITKILD